MTESYIKKLIYKDIASKKELKDFVVLLRITNLIDVVVNLLLTVAFIVFIGWQPVVHSVMWALVNVALFALSYKLESKTQLRLYTLSTILSIVFYCLYVSGGLGLRLIVYTIIPLYYYRVDESKFIKHVVTTTIIALNIILGIQALYQVPIFEISNGLKITVIIITSITMAMKFMVISVFYYKKFAADESKIMNYSRNLELLATQDPLTKLQNRRGLMDYMKKTTENVEQDYMCDIAIGDIDFFKHVNDTYGHEAGDYVLKELSAILDFSMCGKGRVARWGGEEFLFFFENMNGDEAYVVLQDIRNKIKFADFDFKGQHIPITITVGLEEHNPSSTLENTIEAADKKLYQGKENGRNQVVY